LKQIYYCHVFRTINNACKCGKKREHEEKWG